MPYSLSAPYKICCAAVRLAGSFSLANAIFEAVPLDTIVYDYTGISGGVWNVSQPTTIKTPVGYNWFKASGDIFFPINATGIRRATCRLNNAAFIMAPGNTGAGDPNIGAHVNFQSAWYQMIGGTDILNLYAYQDSGAAMALGNGTGCYIAVEFKVTLP